VQALVGSTYPLVQLIGVAQAGALLTDHGLTEVATYARGVGVALPILLGDPSRGEAIRRAGLDLYPFTVAASRVPEPFSDVTAYMSYLVDELGATGIFNDNPDLFPRAR
jgi:glycerophosphoryl diester phosphodiesterase